MSAACPFLYPKWASASWAALRSGWMGIAQDGPPETSLRVRYCRCCCECRWIGFQLPHQLSGKESTCQCRRCRFDPWDRKTGNPLQYSCLENPWTFVSECSGAKSCPTLCHPIDCNCSRLFCPWDFSSPCLPCLGASFRFHL